MLEGAFGLVFGPLEAYLVHLCWYW